MNYETVVGLEIHIELALESKLFCACATTFGAEPNSLCCPVCSGAPGCLPLVNEKALMLAARAAHVLGSEVDTFCRFDRKNYFYPDNPKAYQITQRFHPLGMGGALDFDLPDGSARRVSIEELHLEEDAAKLVYAPQGKILVDYNRAGRALVEIVTKPELHSGEEAAEFVAELLAVMRGAGVSRCRMERGEARVDVNISVRRENGPVGERTEMKNLASLRAVRLAIEAESARQCALLQKGEAVLRETRRWDEANARSLPMREKESGADYMYFPEPDIPPFTLPLLVQQQAAAYLPEKFCAIRRRWTERFGISPRDGRTLLEQEGMAAFLESAIAYGASPKEAVSWLTGEGVRLLETNGGWGHMRPERFAVLLRLLNAGKVNRAGAKTLFAAMAESEKEPETLLEELGLSLLGDETAVREAVQQILRENPEKFAEYRQGKTKLFGWFFGQSVHALSGRADPAAIRKILEEELQ